MILTITSDFGIKDYYLSVIKGAILSENPNLTIIDITHQVENYNIVEGAYILRNAWNSFPEGTIHLISVDDIGLERNSCLILNFEGHYFVGPDNGIFSLLFDSLPNEIAKIRLDPTLNFPLKYLYTKAISSIIEGKTIPEMGALCDSIEQKLNFQPIITPTRIQGNVIYIDNYENVVINISKSLFEKVGNNRSFSIYFKRHDPIQKIHQLYSDVSIGDTLCLFNASDFLEIAVNKGRASSLLGLNIEDTIIVDFNNTH